MQAFLFSIVFVHAWPTSNTEPGVILTAPGVVECPAGYEAITTTEACRAACVQLGRNYDDHGDITQPPWIYQEGYCYYTGVNPNPENVDLFAKHQRSMVCKRTADCLELQVPSDWAFSTCDELVANGHCRQQWFIKAGYCECSCAAEAAERRRILDRMERAVLTDERETSADVGDGEESRNVGDGEETRDAEDGEETRGVEDGEETRNVDDGQETRDDGYGEERNVDDVEDTRNVDDRNRRGQGTILYAGARFMLTDSTGAYAVDMGTKSFNVMNSRSTKQDWTLYKYTGAENAVVACVDAYTAYCPAWQQAGYCQATSIYSAWMLLNCKASCNSCVDDWVTDGTTALTSGDIVVLFNAASNRTLDCAGANVCTAQPFPPPAGHWGTPLRVYNTAGGTIYEGDEVWFTRMWNGVWSAGHAVECTTASCSGQTIADRTLFTITDTPTTTTPGCDGSGSTALFSYGNGGSVSNYCPGHWLQAGVAISTCDDFATNEIRSACYAQCCSQVTARPGALYAGAKIMLTDSTGANALDVDRMYLNVLLANSQNPWTTAFGRFTRPGAQEWTMYKYSGAENAVIGSNINQWVTAGTTALISGDIVALYSPDTHTVMDCESHDDPTRSQWSCTSWKPFPPPAGNWGTPFRVHKQSGGTIYPGDDVWFERMWNGDWSAGHAVKCDTDWCSGQTIADRTPLTIVAL